MSKLKIEKLARLTMIGLSRGVSQLLLSMIVALLISFRILSEYGDLLFFNFLTAVRISSSVNG